MNDIYAHIFRRRKVGQREDVKLRVVDRQGNSVGVVGFPDMVLARWQGLFDRDGSENQVCRVPYLNGESATFVPRVWVRVEDLYPGDIVGRVEKSASGVEFDPSLIADIFIPRGDYEVELRNFSLEMTSDFPTSYLKMYDDFDRPDGDLRDGDGENLWSDSWYGPMSIGNGRLVGAESAYVETISGFGRNYEVAFDIVKAGYIWVYESQNGAKFMLNDDGSSAFEVYDRDAGDMKTQNFDVGTFKKGDSVGFRILDSKDEGLWRQRGGVWTIVHQEQGGFHVDGSWAVEVGVGAEIDNFQVGKLPPVAEVATVQSGDLLRLNWQETGGSGKGFVVEVCADRIV